MDSLVDVERRYKRDADVRDMGDVLQKTVRHHQSSILSLVNYSTVDNEKKKRNKRDERNLQFPVQDLDYYHDTGRGIMRPRNHSRHPG